MLRPFRSTCPTIRPTAYADVSAQVVGDVHVGAALSPEEDASIRRYADNYVRYRLDFQAESSSV